MPKTKDIEVLEDIIVISSLNACKSISEEWNEVTTENPMSWQSNYTVRLETLFFFLHMMSRYAFEINPEARAILQDELVIRTIKRLVETSFDRSNVKKEIDVKALDTKIINEALEYFNEAEVDYSSCKRLGVEDKVGSPSEENVLNKLAWRISRFTGFEFNLKLEFLVWKASIESLAKSKLKEQVKKLVEKG